MSRIGKQPVEIPNNVEVNIDDRVVTLKGSRGELEVELPEELSVEEEDSTLRVKPTATSAAALWGLWRAMLANAVTGVTEGYKKQLELHGVGYRGQKKGDGLELQLGYSHPVSYEPPEGVTVNMEKNVITVEGVNKQLVGQAAAEIRALRPPDSYKGKGVRYVGEVLHLKPGKAAKAVGTE